MSRSRSNVPGSTTFDQGPANNSVHYADHDRSEPPGTTGVNTRAAQ